MTLRCAIVLLCCLQIAAADFIHLRDDATVKGTILAEKQDQVFVDLGFTVLAIPRDHIVKISPAEPTPDQTASVSSTGDPRNAGQLYSVNPIPPRERSVRELVAELGEAVVQVRTPSGLGSGFFVNEEGYLITNFHVIEGETEISVEVYHQKREQLDRRTYKQVRIIAMNKFHDLALLKIEDVNSPRFATVTVGDTEALSVGDRVFAIGSPLGLERTVTEGIVSTKTREVQGNLYLQTTAQINPGNSGGPLFNLRGEVVGVTNMKLLFSEGIGFAIPAYSVKYFLRHRDAYAYDADNPSNPHRYLEPPTRMQQLEEKTYLPGSSN